MEFTLYYKGLLKTNGNPKHKHCLRKCFHRQLKFLWDLEPWSHFRTTSWERPGAGSSIVQEMGGFNFVPLVRKDFHLFADLDITILRPRPPGSVIAKSDIDNQLKTLLDALSIPRDRNALPKGGGPDGGEEDPFFCLLENDNLVTTLKISADQLLDPEAQEKDEALVLIRVKPVKYGTLLGGAELP